MLPCPHSDAFSIQDRRNIMCMRSPLQSEAENRPLILRCALQGQPIQTSQLRLRIIGERLFMRLNRLKPDIHHVIQRHAKSDGLHNARGASLKHHGRIIINHLVFMHFFNHIAAADKGTHFRHPFSAHKYCP